VARQRLGRRDAHPPSGLGNPAAADQRLHRRRHPPGRPLAGHRRGPVRHRHRPHPRRVRPLAQSEGRLLVKAGPPLDRRGRDRWRALGRAADQPSELDRRDHRSRGRGPGRRRSDRPARRHPGADQRREGEVRHGDLERPRTGGWPGGRRPAREAALRLGEALLQARQEGRLRQALRRRPVQAVLEARRRATCQAQVPTPRPGSPAERRAHRRDSRRRSRRRSPPPGSPSAPRPCRAAAG
jgi:hypothetical protein